jgi:hypothetical protein
VDLVAMLRANAGGVLYQPFPMLEGRRGQIWRYAPEYRRPRHFHGEPELNLVVAGSGVFGSGAEVFQVAGGDLLCWPPGRDHELLEASADFDLYVAALTPELNARVLLDRSVAALAGPLRAELGPLPLAELRALCSVSLDTAEAAASRRDVVAEGTRYPMLSPTTACQSACFARSWSGRSSPATSAKTLHRGAR